MTVSRRLRFEILTRDSYTCRYCGRSAPEVKLAVDHVTPVALGGSDEPGNLVTACVDCNGGKSSIGPQNQTVADVAQDAIRWQQAINAVAAKRAEDRDATSEAARRFRDNWMFQYERQHHLLCTDHDIDWCPFELPANFATSVGELLAAGLSTDDLIEGIRQTYGQDFRIRSRWKYFCGVAWEMVRIQQRDARALLDGVADGDEGPPDVLRVPRHEIVRIVLTWLLNDVERETAMKAIADAENGWEQHVLWNLERGYHRERAQRDALASTKHRLDCTMHALGRPGRSA